MRASYDTRHPSRVGCGENTAASETASRVLRYVGPAPVRRASNTTGTGRTPNILLVAFEVGSFLLVAQFGAGPMRPDVEAVAHFRGIRRRGHATASPSCSRAEAAWPRTVGRPGSGSMRRRVSSR